MAFGPVFSQVFTSTFDRHAAGAVVTTNWWEEGGATGIVAAYQPKGATSLVASYTNLANPGTYDAAPGVAPTWDVTSGWILDGVSQYVDTTVLHDDTGQNWSILVRFSNYTKNGNFLLASDNSLLSGGFGLCPNRFNAIRFFNNGQLAISSAAMTSGVMAVAGTYGFKDGVQQSGTIGLSGQVDRTIYVGAGNSGAGAAAYSASKVQAVAIYNTVLTALQVAAVSAAMALV